MVELGPGVEDPHPGDLVCGVVRFGYDGAAAEYVVAPGADLAAKPATVSHAVAAALPLAGLTAWQALVVHGRLRRGDRVLVHFIVTPDRFELARLARPVDRRELRVLVAATFPLHQGRDAFGWAASTAATLVVARGRFVLQVIRDGVEYTSSVE